MAPPSSHDYAGDISAQEAWDLLKSEPKAQLVDVRTMAEWNFVGLPDLAGLGRRTHCVEWQSFPTMGVNPAFAAEAEAAVTAAGAGKDSPILFLCRSGARSRAAAVALTGAGFSRAYNVAGGFEGDPDGERHRGNIMAGRRRGCPGGKVSRIFGFHGRTRKRAGTTRSGFGEMGALQ